MTGQDSLRKYIQAETRKMYGKEESGRKSLPSKQHFQQGPGQCEEKKSQWAERKSRPSRKCLKGAWGRR